MYFYTYAKRAASALAMLIILIIPVFAAIPEASDSFFVNDVADVIDADTETYIVEAAGNLYTETGAQVVVATVNFTDGIEIENYAMQLFNEWGIGSVDRNNGLLILLVIGNEDYWVTPGEGFEELFSGGKLKVILDEYMEPDFAVGDYDAGVRKTFDAVLEELELYYSRTDAPKSDAAVAEDDWIYYDGEQMNFELFAIGSFFRTAIIITLIALFIYLLVKIFHDDDHDDHYRGGGGRGRINHHRSGAFGRGFMGGFGSGIGREVGRSIGRDIGRGFRGSFGGSSSSHRGGSFGSSSGHSRGSFGGGSSSRGGFRGGGGSSRGGGAGRR